MPMPHAMGNPDGERHALYYMHATRFPSLPSFLSPGSCGCCRLRTYCGVRLDGTKRLAGWPALRLLDLQ